jgi:hypothetical protein
MAFGVERSVFGEIKSELSPIGFADQRRGVLWTPAVQSKEQNT